MFSNFRDEVDVAGQSHLYVNVQNTQWPIVYGPEYNIGFMGLEKLHPFDAGKWGRVYEFLKGILNFVYSS